MIDKNLVFKLKEKCEQSSEKEIFYGAKLNKNIKDVYLGLGFLEAKEEGRKGGPGNGHEEIIYIIKGKVSVEEGGSEIILNSGEAFHIPDGTNVILKNLTDEKCLFIIAGGHTLHHSH